MVYPHFIEEEIKAARGQLCSCSVTKLRLELGSAQFSARPLSITAGKRGKNADSQFSIPAAQTFSKPENISDQIIINSQPPNKIRVNVLVIQEFQIRPHLIFRTINFMRSSRNLGLAKCLPQSRSQICTA